MGTYLNPGNSGFARIVKRDYVDKTEMISLVNDVIDTSDNLICVSRPRRFGKSYAAQMLCAYYDRNVDSDQLFQGFKISQEPSYRRFLNQYNVLYVDMTYVKPFCDDYRNITDYLSERITEELLEAYPALSASGELPSTLINAVQLCGRKFIMIIDEWDAPIRENPCAGKDYLEFLRSLFKSSGTTARIFSAVYMTGILPIKKDGSQSAISDFEEYTMLYPYQFAEYIGFTDLEVQELCKKKGADYNRMKQWYDGYVFSEIGAVYNPNSVMKALRYRDFHSYWTETSAAESLMDYITKPYTGLPKLIAELIGGIEVPLNPVGFANDLETFRSTDDVLTLLVHLGYLSYNSRRKVVCIPNEEIRREFSQAVRGVKHNETIKRLQESDQLFYDTIHGNEEAVAEQIEKIHREETAPLHYNRESSLRSVIKLAYYTYRDHYLQWEELPAGDGYADIVYLPKKDSDYPALVIELKWNQSAGGAIRQIQSRNYPEALKNFGGDIMLVGISYDKNAPAGARKHSCRIVKSCR